MSTQLARSVLPPALMAVVLGASALGAIDGPPTAHAAAPVVAPDSLILDLLARINGARISAGVPPLVLASDVRQVALARSLDMAARGYFAHVTLEGVSFQQLLTQHGIGGQLAGENIAYSSFPPDGVVASAYDQWMASPPHQRNILDPAYRRMGIGIASEGGVYYFTAIFLD